MPDIVHLQSGVAPAWLDRVIDRRGSPRINRGDSKLRVRLWSEGPVAFVEAIATRIANEILCDRVNELYRQVFDVLDSTLSPHLWRCWHYLPDIHNDVSPGMDRYMVFNAGRHAAFVDRYGRDLLGAQLPAASAVGHDTDQLVCHMLAGHAPGRAIENPRQTPAYRYSSRYGPLPPCFARGSVIDVGQPMLLLAGTASILGEESRHRGDLAAQLDELCTNLAVMCDAAPDPARLTDLRAYVRYKTDGPAVTEALASRFVHVQRIECVHAQICREELLVEVEGVASFT